MAFFHHIQTWLILPTGWTWPISWSRFPSVVNWVLLKKPMPTNSLLENCHLVLRWKVVPSDVITQSMTTARREGSETAGKPPGFYMTWNWSSGLTWSASDLADTRNRLQTKAFIIQFSQIITGSMFPERKHGGNKVRGWGFKDQPQPYWWGSTWLCKKLPYGCTPRNITWVIFLLPVCETVKPDDWVF